jgi:CheY-like chemotaxis protein
MNLPPYNDLVLRVRLFHTRASEAAPTVAALHAAGCQVDYEDESVTVALRACRASPPDVVVIDLSRLPSHGKEIAIALRQSPATRHLPIVFCGGAADKVAGIRELLPDASFCDLAKLAACARKAASAPPRKAVVPPAMMDRYASRTAAQKLGVKPDSTVGLIGAPRDYKQILGPLPPGILFSEDDLEGAPSFSVSSRMRTRSAKSCPRPAPTPATPNSGCFGARSLTGLMTESPNLSCGKPVSPSGSSIIRSALSIPPGALCSSP